MRLEIAPAEVTVVPGQPAVVVAQVFNTDDVINAYAVRVFGVDPEWVRLEDTRLSLFPGAAGTITVLIDVPRSYPAGELRVGVEVTPLVDPSRRQIGESSLLVPAHREATMTLDPMAVNGGAKTTFNVTLANEGNTPIALTLGSTDPEDKVHVAFDPPVVTLEPKQQVIVPARASAKRPLVGNPVPRMISFTASGADNPLESLASFVQRPRIGRGLMSLFGLLIAISVFALVLTHTLGRVVDVSKIDNKLLERAVNGDTVDRGVPTNPGTVRGTVTLITSGTGVSGVTVELFHADDPTSPVSSAATAGDGTFTMGKLDKGSYKLRFRGAGFVEIWYGGGLTFEDAKEVDVALGKTTGGLDIALGGVPGSIAGKVVGQDPKDALVTLQLPATTLGSATDAQVAQVTAGGDGAFLLDKVPAPASYELVVTKDGFATEKRVVNLSAAETKTGIEISLRKGDGLISGLVTTAGKPLGGVAVTASNTTNESSTISLTSGNVGRFTLRNLATPGTYTLTFSKKGYATQTLTSTLLPGEQRNGADITLTQGTGSIAGTVTRQGVGPIGGVTISVGVDDKTISTESLSVGDVGTYLLTNLPVPGTYTVTFSGAGLATQVRSVDLDPAGNANVTGLNASMTASTAQVTGLVSDENGRAGGVTVVLDNGVDKWTTRSADNPAGTYLLRDVKPGTYTLTFSRDGSVPRSVLVNLTAGDVRTVNVTLQPRATISGTVMRVTGGGTPVTTAPTSSSTSTSSSTTTSDYYPPTSEGVTSTQGTSSYRASQTPTTTPVTTTPLSGAFVVAYRVADYPGTVAAQAVTDANGNYQLRNLSAPDDYIIEFLPPGGGVAKATKQVTLQAGQQMTGVDATLDLRS